MQDSATNLLKGYIEFSNKKTPLRPLLHPFSIWPETNYMLDEYYTQPSVDIKDDTRGLNVKNSMRHIVGSARMQQQHPFLAKPYGALKEIWDLQTEPLAYMYQNKSFNYPKYLKQTIFDTITDFNNNSIGREFIKNNPEATDNEIMDFAHQEAVKNYDRQYNPDSPLFKILVSKTNDN